MALVPARARPPRVRRPYSGPPDADAVLQDLWWGAPTELDALIATVNADGRAKQSTRFLGVGASITACLTDLSQRDLDLSVGASCLLEASPASARFDFSHPRTIGFVITANSTDTGTLFRHGAASPTRFAFNAGASLRATVNNVTAGTLAITGLDATRDTLVVAWTSRDNPDLTGIADAVESTIHCWNITNGTYERTTFTHAASTTKTQTAFFGAADNASTLVYSGAILGIWFENREQSATEIACDWVETRTAPLTETDAEDGHQGIPVISSVAYGATSQVHGPLAQHVCDATRRLYRRTLSPLWNESLRIRTDWTASALTTADPWIRGAPDDSDWRMHLTFLRGYPVPPTANRLFVRVHLRCWSTSGAAVPVGVRLYSMNRPPGILGLAQDDQPSEPFAKFFTETSITRDDDSSNGTWELRATIPIARGQVGAHEGWTYLAVAMQIPSASTRGRVRVSGVHVVPLFVDQAGGLGLGEAGS